MRKTLIALTLLLALAAMVPCAFATAAPAAVPAFTAPAATPNLAATSTGTDFALWLAQNGPGADPAASSCTNTCNLCARLGAFCCVRAGSNPPSCFCSNKNCGL